jgi:hypothetical protein
MISCDYIISLRCVSLSPSIPTALFPSILLASSKSFLVKLNCEFVPRVGGIEILVVIKGS